MYLAAFTPPPMFLKLVTTEMLFIFPATNSLVPGNLQVLITVSALLVFLASICKVLLLLEKE